MRFGGSVMNGHADGGHVPVDGGRCAAGVGKSPREVAQPIDPLRELNQRRLSAQQARSRHREVEQTWVSAGSCGALAGRPEWGRRERCQRLTLVVIDRATRCT